MADQPDRKDAPGHHHRGFRVEGVPEPKHPPKPPARMPGGRRFWLVLLALLVANLVIGQVIANHPSRESVPYSYFRQQVQAGNVSEVTSTGDTIQGTFKKAAKPPDTGGKASSRFQTERPAFADDSLLDLLDQQHVVINAHPIETSTPFWEQLLISFAPTLLIVGLFVLIFRRAQRAGVGGGLGGFGRSRAQLYQPDEAAKRVTFEDVAGIDEAEDELVEVVDFLRNPERYTRLGATVPKGVLLSGPPGTGKTLLARAVAGEAGVPFFSISASEFIEAIVGVGASRVRDMFVEAKAAAPAIIFIDELDAIGRSRGSSATIGGHDEREQTLNQILTEMDGFSGTEGVIVISSTNRPEVLDQALLRPGRFDRRVTVNPPDQTGRRLILEVHTRGVPLGDDVELDALASSTPGMVGADLRNLVNEAALTAARRSHEKVAMADFTDSLERIVLGAERRIVLSAEERERTAYHESGHALLGMLQPGADPVRKVSIIPRGQALGVTFSAPDDDRFNFEQRTLLAQIKVALGGRTAEELVFDDITTGAESDIQHLTQIARYMVGRWGMSPSVGPIAVIPMDGASPFLPGVSETSEETQRLIDGEVRRIVEGAHEEVTELLRSHRSNLDSLVSALLEHETLDETDAYAAAGLSRNPEPASAETPSVV